MKSLADPPAGKTAPARPGPPLSPAIPMDDQEFRLLRDLIQEHAGLFFGDESAYLLQRRLEPRLFALDLHRFIDYYDRLQDPRLPAAVRQKELDDVFERVATGETYFFREDYQLCAFRQEILPRIHRTCPRGRMLSIWSAGCSTGEEPYSLAIEVLESGLFRDWDVRVIGSDLSRTALQKAQDGQYGGSSFRQTEPRLRQHYFRAVADPGDGPDTVYGQERRQMQVADEVRRLVAFSRVNLNQPEWPEISGPFDVIFCRNVLIYFARSRRAQVVDRFDRKLFPGGYLLLGHSESLLDTQTRFEVHHLKRDLVYRKPGE